MKKEHRRLVSLECARAMEDGIAKWAQANGRITMLRIFLAVREQIVDSLTNDPAGRAAIARLDDDGKSIAFATTAAVADIAALYATPQANPESAALMQLIASFKVMPVFVLVISDDRGSNGFQVSVPSGFLHPEPEY